MLLKIDNRPLDPAHLAADPPAPPLRWPQDDNSDPRPDRSATFWVRFWSDLLPAPGSPDLLRYAATRGFLEYW